MKPSVSMLRYFFVFFASLAAVHVPSTLLAQEQGGGGANADALIRDYASAVIGKPPTGLDPFYVKCTDAQGIKVMSSAKVPDAALLVARDIVIHMLSKRPDLRAALVKQGWRIGVMARSESTTDIPEHSGLKKPGPNDRRLTVGEKRDYQRIAKMTDKEYWDRRARGLGGNPTTCAEENLLGYPGTRYFGENILVHEFSHAIMGGAIRRVEPEFHRDIRAAYNEAMKKKLWQGHYAATNANEYWAEGTQTWFYSNYAYHDGETRVQTPEDLKKYDPKLFELLSRVYPDHHVPMDIYHGKNLKRGGSRGRRQREPRQPRPERGSDVRREMAP